jgi:hypothetical protein
MADFPHLNLPFRIGGDYNSPYGPGKQVPRKYKGDQTILNETNRNAHGAGLSNAAGAIIDNWNLSQEQRNDQGLPQLPASLPLFLQVDPEYFNVDSLDSSFGIEVISEEEGGFVIGASTSIQLSELKSKIEKFINEEGKFKNTAAQLWQIVQGTRWRLDQILSQELLDKWEEITDYEILTVDIGIASFVRVSNFPTRSATENLEEYEKKVGRWHQRKEQADRDRDDLQMVRQDELESFLAGHDGCQVTSSYIDQEDSFSCRIDVTGGGLKDLVLNYPYLFEVVEYDPLGELAMDFEGQKMAIELEILSPNQDAPKVCVIDSGIQEGHRLMSPAIDANASKSYVPGEEGDTADMVRGGGHGTRVASAVIYPQGIPRYGQFKPVAWIQNARILDSNNRLRSSVYPPAVLSQIIEDFHIRHNTRIFNHSIASSSPCRLRHMAPWAAHLDRLSWQHDVLFIVATGNLYPEDSRPNFPGIKEHLAAGRQYPDYFHEKSCRVADPSHSLNCISVGSVCIDEFEDIDTISFGRHGDISSFSRSGYGIWNTIKPDVVEFGGDYIREKNSNPNLRTREETSPELVRSTLTGGSSIGRDSIGTSYAAPKVAHIAAAIAAQHPDETCLTYRALIAQSARWPQKFFESEVNEERPLRFFGYGIPNIERATQNSAFRITMLASNEIAAKEAHLYSVKVPPELRTPGDNFRILVEVTLSFKAKPRRTRRGTRSYLSTWLDWESSKFEENFERFKSRMVKNVSVVRDESSESDNNYERSIPWKIRNRINSGIPGVKLQDNTLQKDWVIISSFDLPEDLGIAIVGHQGWEKDLREQVPYSLVVSFEALDQNLSVYQSISIENQVEIEQEIRIQ